jgi:hypothetical protein
MSFTNIPPNPAIGSYQAFSPPPPPTPPGRPPSLDATGTQAAVYPSEQQLWFNGPLINDPGDQGVQAIGAQTFMGAPPEPTGASGVQAEEEFLFEQINGPTSNGAYGMWWVPLRPAGQTGFGEWQYTVSGSPSSAMPYTGHDANVISNPSAEQGWGVGPARRWAHWPWTDSPNPARNGAHLRNGDFPWVALDSYLYERAGLAYEAQWQPYKYRGAVAPVVPVAGAVPFAQVVPTSGGGPSPMPALDVPAIGPQPIYPYWPNP